MYSCRAVSRHQRIPIFSKGNFTSRNVASTTLFLVYGVMSLSSQRLQHGRLHGLDIENHEVRETSIDRFSDSSADSHARLAFTPRSNSHSNPRGLMAILKRTGWRLKKSCGTRFWLTFWVVIAFAITATIIWMSFVAVLIHRLSPQPIRNGLHEIVNNWRAEDPTAQVPSSRFEHFSRDIQPVPCHSHNDYLRQVPLYQALEAGCISVEADIWLEDDAKFARDLYVGHSFEGLRPSATLKSLYIDPLVAILEHQNANSDIHALNNLEQPYGVFDSSPETSLVLLLDFKNDAQKTWSAVEEQLEPLRERGMLTSWNGTTKTITQKPITVVGTGNAPFDLIIANSTYRDIFFDAPLDELNDTYTSENSYYASVSFVNAIGKFWFRPSWSQTKRIKSQIAAASRNGLKARYWDTPGWPIARRNRVWTLLVETGVGVLNVDDVVNAGRWNWDWCLVAGLVLCG